MFGKKTKIIITVSDEKINIRGTKSAPLSDVMEAIKGMACMIEEQTNLEASTILTKCAFELI